jgi:ring-1,2-phenylacetyl-CoA epoxidase subunit PaaE
LFYANRTVSSIILKEELEALKNQHMGRLEIFYFLTRQSRSIPLLDGRIDTDKISELVDCGLLDLSETDHFFSCGPQEMVFNVRDYLIANKVAADKIHFELFNTSAPTSAMREKVTKGQEGKMSEILIIEGGKTLKFNLERGSNNILDAALANNADLPYACKGGVCCTCRAKVKEGKVEMLLSYGLEQDEIDDGYVLTCQTFPMSDKVVIDFDS